jgi:ferrochelatase
MKPGLLFLNFGGPTCDEELEPFLRNLLADVLPGPERVAGFAASILAPRRAEKVRETYREIGWSPLVADTREQVAGTLARMTDPPPHALGMMFTEPSVPNGVKALLDQGCDHIIAIGLYPHYSFATSAASYEMVHKALVELGRPSLPVHYARAFFDDPTYLEAVAATIREAASTMDGEGPIHLLFSAHGIPLSFVRRGDPYPEHVRASVRGVVQALGWEDPWDLAWQSRLGPIKWLDPDTRTTLREYGKAGVERVLIVPISFVGEHIETLDEIDREFAELAHEAGIPHFGRAAALGTQPAFLQCMADLATEALGRFDHHRCSRCLVPKPDAHRRRKRCDSCSFVLPTYLQEGVGA